MSDLQAIFQSTSEAAGLGDGIVAIVGITSFGLLAILAIIERFTKRNIWDYLSQIDGISIIAIGTSLAVLYALGNQDFRLVRVYGTPIAGLLIGSIALGSDRIDSSRKFAYWLTIEDGLRAVVFGSSITILASIATKGPQNIGIGDYLAGFPIAGIITLVVILFVPAKKIADWREG